MSKIVGIDLGGRIKEWFGKPSRLERFFVGTVDGFIARRDPGYRRLLKTYYKDRALKTGQIGEDAEMVLGKLPGPEGTRFKKTIAQLEEIHTQVEGCLGGKERE